MNRPEPLQSVMQYLSRFHQTPLIPEVYKEKIPEALVQAKLRLEPADGECVVEIITLIHSVLNQQIPKEDVYAIWIHLLAEYPEAVLRNGAREMLKKHFGKPVPADICRVMEPELKARKRDLSRIKSIYARHSLNGELLPKPEPERIGITDARRLEG